MENLKKYYLVWRFGHFILSEGSQLQHVLCLKTFSLTQTHTLLLECKLVLPLGKSKAECRHVL